MRKGGARLHSTALLGALLIACASSPPPPPPPPPLPAAPPSRAAAVERHQTRAGPAGPAAPAAPTTSEPTRPKLCGVSDSEAELAALVSSQVGLGLLWLADGASESRAPDGRLTERSQRSFRHAAKAVRQSLSLAKCMLRSRDAGFSATLRKGQGAIEAWLDTHLDDPADAPVLLSAGTAYFASLLSSDSPMDAMLDVPIALTLLERAVRFAPSAQDGLGMMLLGAYDCYLPPPVGGQPVRGSGRLQKVADNGGGLARVAQVVDAEFCMVGLQNRARFQQLLTEVIESGAKRRNTGLSPFDGMARGRAAWLLSEEEEFFLE